MTGTCSEQALLAQCKAGDHAAFTELIQRNSMVALRTIRAIAPNPADVDDIMQETLLNAYKGLHRFNEQCKFSTWLTRIAINNAFAVLRRQKRRMEISLDGEGNESEAKTGQFADVRTDPEGDFMRNETGILIRRAMNALPVHLRQYARGRFLDERSHEEVSASLGISVAAGKSRSLRARQRLEIPLTQVFARVV
jgi:RNA polymerase sigma-70 factor (ECF subfamily)